ncbi:MAG: NAD(P)H-hydrate dehydratase [archaeon]|nr:NAD(P)H-hydrate dehydratase [archaeon]
MDNNSTDYGIPIDFLMECAGFSSANTIIKKYSLKKKDKVLILCGAGNNGGDGFVIARHLAANMIDVNIIFVGNPKDIRTKHSLLNWKILSNLYLHITKIIIKDSSFFKEIGKKLPDDIMDPNIVVDCLLGTGIKGKIREPIKSAILLINDLKKMGKKIVSIDVPSGLNPDDGSIPDICVNPDLLITFHREKIGFKKSTLKIPEIIINSIGIPEDTDLFIGSGDLKTNLNQRDPFNHKGQHGKVLIIGGSEQYSGAPALSALAAMQMDMDLVIVYAPNTVVNAIRSYSSNLIVREGRGKNICKEDISDINELIEWADSIVLGPGIGQSEETRGVIEDILKSIADKGKPVVIDADAIRISASYKDLLKKNNAVITPHASEFFTLTNTKLPDQNEFKERAKILELVALNFGVTFLIKGKYDYISNSEKTRINKTGVPEMAVGGTGDILTGIVASLLALGINKFDAACIGAYINGKLGEKYKEINQEPNEQQIKTFKSSDLIDIIPMIIGKYL